MLHQRNLPDGRPTIADWPVQIQSPSELPPLFAKECAAQGKAFLSGYTCIYAPRRRTDPDSYAYLFCYGKEELFYIREYEGESSCLTIRRPQLLEIQTRRELLKAEIILRYHDQKGEEKTLSFPYVPSVYYLYDPFLNWTLRLPEDFLPAAAESAHPRPQKLYQESLPAFNYSLAAYRLGASFSTYTYSNKLYRKKWMPWKKQLEEWLEIPMERGLFCLHLLGYLTECSYQIAPSSQIPSDPYSR